MGFQEELLLHILSLGFGECVATVTTDLIFEQKP